MRCWSKYGLKSNINPLHILKKCALIGEQKIKIYYMHLYVMGRGNGISNRSTSAFYFNDTNRKNLCSHINRIIQLLSIYKVTHWKRKDFHVLVLLFEGLNNNDRQCCLWLLLWLSLTSLTFFLMVKYGLMIFHLEGNYSLSLL